MLKNIAITKEVYLLLLKKKLQRVEEQGDNVTFSDILRGVLS